MVANPLSGAFALAAAPRQPLFATTFPTSSLATRVGGFRHPSSGRSSRRSRHCSINTPGSRACGYKTASGRRKWLNRDPIEERGGINLFECVYNSPVSLVDTFGLEVPALDSVDGNPTVAIDICLQEQGLQRTEVNLASKLARAMCRAGRAVKKGNQAHHIVAENDKRAVIARNALKKFGIDINAPENGVGLPARFHQVMHDQEYYDMLKMQANEWTTKEECILGLRKIATALEKLAEMN